MSSPSTWSKAALDEMRQIGDPPADQVIAALTAGGQVDSVNQLMRDLIRNDRLPPEAMRPMAMCFMSRLPIGRGGERPSFNIPTQLRQAWGMA